MANIPVSGAVAYCQYGIEETAFKTESAGVDKAFGHDVKGTYDMNNNGQIVYDLGSQAGAAYIPGLFGGRLSLDFMLTGQAWWLTGLVGDCSSVITGEPEVHTYTTANTTDSLSVEIGVDAATTDTSFMALGSKIDTMTMTGRTNEPIRVSLGIPFATVSDDAAADATPATDSEEVLTFANFSLDMPSGTTIANLSDFTLSVGRNVNMVYDLGAAANAKRIASTTYLGQQEYRLSVVGRFVEPGDFFYDFLGDQSSPYIPQDDGPDVFATLVLNITNGLADEDERHMIWNFTNGYIDSHSMTFNPADPLEFSADIMIRGLTSAIMENDTDAEP